MNVKELYDHITKHMTAEQALMKLLEGHVLTYEKLKFQEGEEIHPTILVAMAALDMGWNLAIPNKDDNDELQGMAIGTHEYLDKLFPEDKEEKFRQELKDLKSKYHNHVFELDGGACTTCGKTVADILNEPADFKRLTRLSPKEVEIVVAWMNTWEQLRDTAIPMRFKSDFGEPIKMN